MRTLPPRWLCSLALGAALFGCRSFGGAGSGPPAPGSPLHDPSPPGRWHVVTAGETWPAIAARAGVPLEDLLEINGVARVGPLSPGQVVYVLEPTGGSAPAPPPMISAEDDRLAWPLHAPRVSSPFGTREGRPHEGIDLAAPTGTPVHAAGDGFVLYAGDGVSGYGHMVVLQHAGDLLTVYAHNSVVVVKMGDRVRRGQEIARVGQSGRATAPHLHFEVRRGEVPRDPLAHLPPLP